MTRAEKAQVAELRLALYKIASLCGEGSVDTAKAIEPRHTAVRHLELIRSIAREALDLVTA